MKKILCVFFLLFTFLSSPFMSSIYAFDNSLDGTWGIVMNDEKLEMVRFNSSNKEIIIMNFLFRQNDYTSADYTIHIYSFDGNSVIIQYYRLAPNKLLFTIWNTDDITQTMTLILSKL